MGFETGTFTLSHLVPGCTGGERKGAGIEGMGGAMRKGADWLFVLQLYGYSPYVHDTEQKSIPEQSGHYLALKMRRKKDERLIHDHQGGKETACCRSSSQGFCSLIHRQHMEGDRQL